MYQVKKRDGRIVDFDISKISGAIEKAFKATETAYTEEVIDLLSLRVTARFQPYLKDDKIGVEEIQDLVEETLGDSGYSRVAKAYIQYREKHAKARKISGQIRTFANQLMEGTLGPVDVTEMHDGNADPVEALDIMKNQNASVGSGTIGSSILQNNEAVTKLFWEDQYTEDICKASQIDNGEGRMYIHDLGFAGGYCAGWSLKDLIVRGITGVPNKTASGPAAHLSTLCNQMVNFLGILQNEWAGAQAFSSFDTYLAPFVKVDNLPYDEVKQCIQSFVFGVNVPSRWGCQSPFSNITLDWTIPEDMAPLPAIVKGKEQNFTYGDCQHEADLINKAFIEVMVEGDYEGRGFAYPINVAV